jgi:hypothetical protein
LWDLSTGKQLRSFSEQEGSVHAAAFSRDGRFALSGGAQALKLWGVATGKELPNWAIGNVDSVALQRIPAGDDLRVDLDVLSAAIARDRYRGNRQHRRNQ